MGVSELSVLHKFAIIVKSADLSQNFDPLRATGHQPPIRGNQIENVHESALKFRRQSLHTTVHRIELRLTNNLFLSFRAISP